MYHIVLRKHPYMATRNLHGEPHQTIVSSKWGVGTYMDVGAYSGQYDTCVALDTPSTSCMFRVAQNMLQSDMALSNNDLAVVRLLLENCIKLLGEEDRSKVRRACNGNVCSSLLPVCTSLRAMVFIYTCIYKGRLLHSHVCLTQV